MKNNHCCPKCGSAEIKRIPDNGRYASGNNIYTTTVTLFGKIPVIRYVCCNCGYVENLVEKPNELDKIEAEMKEWKQQDEDVLTYALFPQVALDFFKYRQAQQEKVDMTQADTANGAYPA